MIKELKYVFYLIIIFFFIFFVSRYYFSDEHKKKSYRSLSNLDERINIFSENLVTLENDTNNIITVTSILRSIDDEDQYCNFPLATPMNQVL